jgi:CheY-like chemotaxis protein
VKGVDFVGDQFWLDVLKDIQKAAHNVEPAVETAAADPRTSSVVAHYSTLLGKIKDAIALCDQNSQLWATNDEKPKGPYTVNLAQQFREFGEGFGTRFGEKWAAKTSFFIEANMPIVRTYPQQLNEFLDALTRWVQIWHNPSGDSHLRVRMPRKNPDPFGLCEVEFSLYSSAFKEHAERLQWITDHWDRSFFAAVNTPESDLLREFGVDFYTALRIGSWLGAVPSLVDEGEVGTILRFSFRFELNPRVYPLSVPLREFCFFSHNLRLKRELSGLAHFHGVNAFELASVKDVNKEMTLVYDACDYDLEELKVLAKRSNPEQTLVFIPEARIELLRELAEMGFTQTITYPIVSTHFMRALGGYESFKPNQPLFGEDSLPSLKVAVVDDSPTARILMRDHLEALGHMVFELFDGSHLVRMIEAGQKFDFIFCDLNMPHMDGITAVKKVRAFERAQNISRPVPVVLVTAYTEIAAHEKAKEAGFDHVVQKPIDLADIRQLMTRFFTMTAIRKNEILRTKIIDLHDLKERCSGKERLMVRVLEAFLESSKDCLLKLRDVNPEEDIVTTTQIIHTLKGMLRDSGGKNGANSLEEIENKIKGATFSAPTDLPKVEQIVTSAQEEASILRLKLSNP